jgi:glycosyltransferase involved in cell wall biosynthesis
MRTEVPEKKYRLAILQRHPIQYHSPIFREIAQSAKIEQTVLFMDKIGLNPIFDPTMNEVIEWDIPLLEGFRHEFLTNWSPYKTRVFISRINPGILWWLKRGRYDGVLIQGYDTASNILALLVARLARLDIIFRGEVVSRSSRGSLLTKFFKSCIVRMFLRNSDAILYTCSGNRKFFLNFGCPDSKLYPFPCAVDNAFFRTSRAELQKSKTNLRDELGIDENTIVAIMVGRMDTNKRQKDLIQAAVRLQDQGRNVATVFVGNGPERKRLENFAKTNKVEKIHFVGFKNQSQISGYYDMADVFCICSEADRSPKVINEALNFELPIISSDRPGTIGDSIIEGENALVYKCADIDALAACLDRLITNPELRRKFGKRSFELSDELSLEADVESLERVVEVLQMAKCKGATHRRIMKR